MDIKSTLLQMNNVRSGYGGIDVLKGVSLQVEEGDFVSIIGSNGAGKTTLFRTIAGLIRASHGTILFNGENIVGMRPKHILHKGLACVLQDRSIFPDMTVTENIELGAFTIRNKNEIRQRIEIVYELFPVLRKRGRQKAGTLSGGEQRMVEVGRALMLKPKLLLLDEPSAGLAPLVTNAIFGVFKTLNQGGTAVLLVEQNATRALRIAERGYVLELGSIRFDGRCTELLANEQIKRAYLGD